MQMERGSSLVPSNALLIQVQVPLLPCSWKHLIDDGEPRGWGNFPVSTALPVPVCATCVSHSAIPGSPVLILRHSGCGEGVWKRMGVMSDGSFLDFAAPHTPTSNHILLFPALLVSLGAAAGFCHGLGVGTQCWSCLAQTEPAHCFLLSQSHSNYPGDFSKRIIELLWLRRSLMYKWKGKTPGGWSLTPKAGER